MFSTFRKPLEILMRALESRLRFFCVINCSVKVSYINCLEIFLFSKMSWCWNEACKRGTAAQQTLSTDLRPAFP